MVIDRITTLEWLWTVIADDLILQLHYFLQMNFPYIQHNAANRREKKMHFNHLSFASRDVTALIMVTKKKVGRAKLNCWLPNKILEIWFNYNSETYLWSLVWWSWTNEKAWKEKREELQQRNHCDDDRLIMVDLQGWIHFIGLELAKFESFSHMETWAVRKASLIILRGRIILHKVSVSVTCLIKSLGK